VLELRKRVLRFAHDMSNVEIGETAASCELTALHLDNAARKSIAFEDKVHAPAQIVMG
jgi:acyl-CoA thioester hydrolase